MSSPSVSVLMVVRDCERYLGEALESALRQSVAPLEIVVVDDGSRDRSALIAERFGSPVRVLRQFGQGIGAARNVAAAAARGEFLAFLDADDRLPPRSLEVRLDALAREPSADLIWGMVRHFHSPDLEPELARRLPNQPDLAPAHLPGGLLVRRTAFDRVGPFRDTLRIGEFVDWGARAHELHVIEITVPEVVLERRIHTDHHMLRHRDQLTDLTRVMRSALHRRRTGTQR